MLFQRSEMEQLARRELAGITDFSSRDQIDAAASRRMAALAADVDPVAVSQMTFDIFLSHAYADKLIAFGVYTRLSKLHLRVYVDWIHDTALNRGRVTPATAAVIRQRLRQCSSLFYLTTQHHAASKWMPWECGYFDGADGSPPGMDVPEYAVAQGHVAILPVVDEPVATFLGQEYLGLYCYASEGTGSHRDVEINAPGSIASTKPRSVQFDPWIQGEWPT